MCRMKVRGLSLGTWEYSLVRVQRKNEGKKWFSHRQDLLWHQPRSRPKFHPSQQPRWNWLPGTWWKWVWSTWSEIHGYHQISGLAIPEGHPERGASPCARHWRSWDGYLPPFRSQRASEQVLPQVSQLITAGLHNSTLLAFYNQGWLYKVCFYKHTCKVSFSFLGGDLLSAPQENRGFFSEEKQTDNF